MKPWKRISRDALQLLLVTLAMLGMAAVIVAFGAAYGEFMYDDWRCGFTQCRILVP